MCLILDSTMDRYVICCKSCVFIDTHSVNLMDLCKYLVIYQSLWINVMMNYLHLKGLEKEALVFQFVLFVLPIVPSVIFKIRSYSSDHLGGGGVSG